MREATELLLQCQPSPVSVMTNRNLHAEIVRVSLETTSVLDLSRLHTLRSQRGCV